MGLDWRSTCSGSDRACPDHLSASGPRPWGSGGRLPRVAAPRRGALQGKLAMGRLGSSLDEERPTSKLSCKETHPSSSPSFCRRVDLLERRPLAEAAPQWSQVGVPEPDSARLARTWPSSGLRAVVFWYVGKLYRRAAGRTPRTVGALGHRIVGRGAYRHWAFQLW